MMPKKSISKTTMPTILGILFLVIGIIAGVLTIHSRQLFRSRAQNSSVPTNIQVTNISDKSFTVSWATPSESTGFVVWGESHDNLVNKVDTNTKSQIHHVDILGLAPSSTYYFQIFIDDRAYSNDSPPMEVTTSNQLPQPLEPLIASGTILNADGTPADHAVVYLQIDTSSLRSTLTSSAGRWIIPISEVRDAGLNSYINIDLQSSIILLRATDGKSESTVSIYPNSLNPVPDITLGKSYELLELTENTESFQNPEAEMNTEDNKSDLEREVDVTTSIANVPEEVVVEIIKVEEDEIVDEALPEFFGTGTPNLEITITIESDPITETVIIDQNGSWDWLPPVKLDNGTHTITIKYLDANGILNSITRQFVVNAAAGSGSQTTPTKSPSPTLTISPTPTPTMTPTPVTELPSTGTVQITVLLIGFFVTTIAFSLLILLV